MRYARTQIIRDRPSIPNHAPHRARVPNVSAIRFWQSVRAPVGKRADFGQARLRGCCHRVRCDVWCRHHLASTPRQILKPFRDHFLALPGSNLFGKARAAAPGAGYTWVPGIAGRLVYPGYPCARIYPRVWAVSGYESHLLRILAALLRPRKQIHTNMSLPPRSGPEPTQDSQSFRRECPSGPSPMDPQEGKTQIKSRLKHSWGIDMCVC